MYSSKQPSASAALGAGKSSLVRISLPPVAAVNPAASNNTALGFPQWSVAAWSSPSSGLMIATSSTSADSTASIANNAAVGAGCLILVDMLSILKIGDPVIRENTGICQDNTGISTETEKV